MTDSASRPSSGLELSRELIDAVFKTPVADDEHAMPLASKEEVVASLDDTLAQRPDDGDLWVFGYGSLMWRPELTFLEQRLGKVEGWRRSFCLWQWRYRGTRERPGLMLALDDGGNCSGVLYRLADLGLRDQLIRLWEREMTGRGYVPRWVEVESGAGTFPAITFLVNRDGTRYAGRLPVDTAADHISKACGHAGPSAAYLLETWLSCRHLGISDPYVEALAELVASRLVAQCGDPM